MPQVATPTLLDTANNGFGTSVATTAGNTPGADSLLVACITWRDGADTLSSVTGTWGGAATFTIAEQVLAPQSGAAIAWAIVNGSPGAGNATATFTNNANAMNIDVIEVTTGFNTTNPVAQAVSASELTPADGTFSASNLSTPNANSIIISTGVGWSVITSTAAPFTGFTELNEEITNSTPNNSQWADGSNGTSYGIILGSTPSNSISIVAVEIQEASVGSSVNVSPGAGSMAYTGYVPAASVSGGGFQSSWAININTVIQ